MFYSIIASIVSDEKSSYLNCCSPRSNASFFSGYFQALRLCLGMCFFEFILTGLTEFLDSLILCLLSKLRDLQTLFPQISFYKYLFSSPAGTLMIQIAFLLLSHWFLSLCLLFNFQSFFSMCSGYILFIDLALNLLIFPRPSPSWL